VVAAAGGATGPTDHLLPGGLSISDLTVCAYGAQLSELLTRVLLTIDRAEVDY